MDGWTLKLSNFSVTSPFSNAYPLSDLRWVLIENSLLCTKSSLNIWYDCLLNSLQGWLRTEYGFYINLF